jgi:hypothetical protein
MNTTFLLAAVSLEHLTGADCGGCGLPHADGSTVTMVGTCTCCPPCRVMWEEWFTGILAVDYPDLAAKVTKDGRVTYVVFSEALRRLEAEVAILESTP